MAHLASSDANAVLPADAALVAGTQTFNVTLKTAASKNNYGKRCYHTCQVINTSTPVVVGSAAFVKMQILMPGETAAPGSATGKPVHQQPVRPEPHLQ
ncbi:hypothetical protein [Mucilaginibacter humi]|uniref:hypothetical protein n=1 Tax=Mucilaginibacter humi TaxID=2732510 RepID=UPI001585192A|nr:hypothetical protein [Mucilaginibacter humi]